MNCINYVYVNYNSCEKTNGRIDCMVGITGNENL